MVRDLVGSDNRPMESSDEKYINDILITPLQKMKYLVIQVNQQVLLIILEIEVRKVL